MYKCPKGDCSLSFSSFIAFRYIKANRSNRFFSWIAVLSVSGIAIGVAAMIVVLSVINGFEAELRSRFLVANAHVTLYQFPSGMVAPNEWASTVKKDFLKEIKGISYFVHGETLIRKDSLMHALMIRGIVPEAREHVESLKPFIKQKDALNKLQEEINDPKLIDSDVYIPGIIIGSGLLSLLSVKVGEVVELVAPEGGAGGLKKFRVVGVYDTGLTHYDKKIGILSLEAAKKFFKMGDRVTGLEIGLFKPQNSREIAAIMSETYADVAVREWQSFNRALFDAMEMERAVIAFIVALVAFVASFNILTTLFISVSHKQKDISILKSLGASNRQIQWIFIQQGAFIGLIGSLVGVILAFIISQMLERYQFVDLPDMYLLTTLPITYGLTEYVSIALGGVVICVLAGLYPARVATRALPAEGFKVIQ